MLKKMMLTKAWLGNKVSNFMSDERGDFNYTHKKQSGGSGQYGRVAGFMEPISEKDYEAVESF